MTFLNQISIDLLTISNKYYPPLTMFIESNAPSINMTGTIIAKSCWDT